MVDRPGARLARVLPLARRMNVLVADAVRARRLLRFIYEGYERIIEPHLHGINAANHEMVSGYLVGGWSATETTPGWRNYLVAQMHDVHVLAEPFAAPRAGFNPADPQFRQLYATVDGGDAPDRDTR